MLRPGTTFGAVDVTEASFQTDVIERSMQVPVVVDLWAEWCGPCKQLGPILEKVIGETDGAVVLAKVDVDANPRISQAFRVQGIPAVFAISGGQPVDSFVGALPEPQVREFVGKLVKKDPIAELIEIGSEAALRHALTLEPGHVAATVALAKLLVDVDKVDEALQLLETVPETPEVRHVKALARNPSLPPDIDLRLGELLEGVKSDDAARTEFLDLLEVLGPDDPRTPAWRKRLTAKLF
jgi:putative thioredoxin